MLLPHLQKISSNNLTNKKQQIKTHISNIFSPSTLDLQTFNDLGHIRARVYAHGRGHGWVRDQDLLPTQCFWCNGEWRPEYRRVQYSRGSDVGRSGLIWQLQGKGKSRWGSCSTGELASAQMAAFRCFRTMILTYQWVCQGLMGTGL